MASKSPDQFIYEGYFCTKASERKRGREKENGKIKWRHNINTFLDD